MNKIKLTILTPTFNRASLLIRAYESLINQSNKCFEWIIVDDGSTDNTSEVVSNFSADLFPIIYLKKTNGGKHTAINQGVKIARGYLTLILDSDDILTPDAVEFIDSHTSEIRGNKFAGISGLRGFIKNDNVIGDNIIRDDRFIDASNIHRKKYKLNGDKAEAYKTEILIKYPFPEFDKENFIKENVVWDRIALDGYIIRWYKKIIYKTEYLPGGLTLSSGVSKYAENFEGFTESTRISLLYAKIPTKYLIIGLYAIVAKYKKISNNEICDRLKIGKLTLLFSESLYKIKKTIKRT